MYYKSEKKRFGRTPTMEEMVMAMKLWSYQDICEFPFSTLNALLGTNFPKNANGEAHRVVYEALQRTVTEEKMQAPLELVLRSDGLMIRVCSNEQATFYAEALKLAKQYHLSEDRITHGLCPECEKKTREEAMARRQAIRDNVIDLSIFDWDGPEEETNTPENTNQ